MGTSRQVLLHDLSPALTRALAEQCARLPDIALVTQAPDAQALLDSGQVNLMICRRDGTRHAAGAPAIPRLHLPADRRLRLGGVLRDMLQMLRDPALYLEDFALGPYLFAPPDRRLTAEGRELSLTERECDILVYLARFQNRPVARENILRDVWRYQDGIDTHTLETHIYRLRQKIEHSADHPALLVTESGGYCLRLTPAA